VVDVYIIVGSGGKLGSQISNALKKFDVPIVKISGAYLASLNDQEFSEAVAGLVNEIGFSRPNVKQVGLVLAHRYRGLDILTALRVELCITRNLVWRLSEHVKRLNVVVVGSITGRYIDRSSPEAYHFAKEMQRLIVRQSIMLPNVAMNAIELSWFEKYSTLQSTPEYRSQMGELRGLLGQNNLPSPADIAEFIRQLLDCALPPRGQSIVYDGGYDLFQR